MKRYQKLIEIARASKPIFQQLRAYHVAAIFKKNELISVGWNTRKTHPKTINFYPFSHKATHAEALAIIRGQLEDYSGHDLMVLRVNNNGEIDYSKPCQYCNKFIEWLGFDNIFYSGHNGELIKL